MARSPDNGQHDCFYEFYAKGENPNGFRALTPNGVASDTGEGMNHCYHYGPAINGPRWTMPEPEYPLTIAPPGRGVLAPKRGGNRNRTGE